MKMPAFLLLVTALLASCNTNDTYNLATPPGEYVMLDLGEPAEAIEVSVELHLTEFTLSKEWPPAAYFGLYDPNSRNNKFQFLIIRNKVTDDFILGGYRVIQGGEEAQVGSIARFPTAAAVKAKLKINNGKVKVKIPGYKTHIVETKLSKVQPYISVSSGKAEIGAKIHL